MLAGAAANPQMTETDDVGRHSITASVAATEAAGAAAGR